LGVFAFKKNFFKKIKKKRGERPIKPIFFFFLGAFLKPFFYTKKKKKCFKIFPKKKTGLKKKKFGFFSPPKFLPLLFFPFPFPLFFPGFFFFFDCLGREKDFGGYKKKPNKKIKNLKKTVDFWGK